MKSLVYIIVAVLFLVTGCRTIDPEIEKSISVTVPNTYERVRDTSISGRHWWETFENEELNDLINKALKNSFDLKTMTARLEQARAVLEKENASLLPQLDYSVGGKRQATKVKKSRSSASVTDGSHSWDAGVTGSWSPDIWGQDRASRQAQQDIVEAVKQDMADVRSELAAQIAELWIDIIAVRKKIQILDRQIKSSTTQLELQQLRYANGKANVLDVSQQREALAETRSQIPLLQRQEKLLLNTLAFVSGKSSFEEIPVHTTLLPEGLAMPSPGVPSTLLENRPDIRAARQRLVSSLWEEQAARADLLPSLTLTARALFSAGELDLLFSNWVASLTAAITGPIFDGGLKKAEVERAAAAAREQASLYAKAVAKAIREVEDSLVTIDTQDAYIRLLEEELDLARLTVKDALLQYWNGKSSYLSYLIVLTRIERLERQLVGEKATAVKERIKLYRGLGFSPIPSQTRT